MTTGVLRQVRIVDLPVELVLDTLRHFQDLLHELRIAQVGRDHGSAEIGAHLASVMDEIVSSYTGAYETTWQEATRALEAGKSRMDLVLELPAEAGEASTRLLTLLEEADELCRTGDLLTVAAPPEVVALRRWWNRETLAQLEGSPPQPCPL